MQNKLMDKPFHGVITDDEAAALRQRNEARAKQVKNAMGVRYVCHPANRVKRQPEARIIPASLLIGY